MKIARIVIIIITNLYLIAAVIKALFIDPSGDTNSLFSLFIIAIIIVCNIYYVIISQIFTAIQKKNIYSEILFTLAIGAPCVLFLYAVL